MSEILRAVLARVRGMKVPVFCQRYNIGPTATYAEIKAGRLKARKRGRSTIISEDDAEDWLRNLPLMGAELTADQQQSGKRFKSAPRRRESVS